jgi:hypothetical protein
MKKAALIALAAFVIATISAPSEARPYQHGYGYCGYGLHYDYSHGNGLSALGYIYPAANWGPFFACRMYYSSVYIYQPVAYSP